MSMPPAPAARLTRTDLVRDPPLRAYLSNVRDWHGYVRFLGLPDRRENPDVLIDRLFVWPLLTRRLVSPDEDPAIWLDHAETVLTALADDRPLLLLGAPGAGKTTLLNWLAWLLARPADNELVRRLGWRLPVPMVLRELPLRGATTFDGLLEAFLAHAMSEPLRGNDRLRSMLDQGRAFLLLDGIDEIGSVEARKQLRQAVAEGMQRYPKCRWALSSRVVGYEEVRFHKQDDRSLKRAARDASDPGAGTSMNERCVTPFDDRAGMAGIDGQALSMNERYVAPFDDNRIEAFARQWYQQREAARARAGANASDLVRAVHEDQSILVLSRVPNLLTLMALIHRIDADLPHGRALLYSRIAQTYLESIDRYRGIESGSDHFAQAKYWLARVGYEMQRRRTASVNDTGEETEQARGSDMLVHSAEVMDWLMAEMAGRPYGRAGNSTREHDSSHRRAARDFLDFAERRSGLFLPRGEGRHAFIHLSFQEYFAAVALEREVTGVEWAQGDSSGRGVTRDEVAAWAGHPAWRETFVFLFELLAPKPDWHAFMLDRIFGENFSGLALDKSATRTISRAAKESQDKSDSGTSHLALLAARLTTNPHAGLTSGTRKAMLGCLAILALSVRDPLDEDSNSLLVELVSEDPERNKELFGLIRRLMETDGAADKLLDLSHTRITDLAPVAEITALRMLNLAATQIENLTPLKELKALEWLNLCQTPVSDLTPLRETEKLKWLFVDRTRVADITPLADIESIERLSLGGSPVEDFGPVAKLPALEELVLRETQVRDLAPLADSNLPQLTRLDLSQTRVEDLAPLAHANLPKLDTLELHGTAVSDLTSLANANLPNLRRLGLGSTQVADLAPLAHANLPNLRWLILGGTQVVDLTPLAKLPNLFQVVLFNTGVSDLAPLANANLPNLSWINLDSTQVADLAPLANLSDLYSLSLRSTAVADLAPLANANLPNLSWLTLSSTAVADLTPLADANLPKLEYLDLSRTQVVDLTPLIDANLPKLESLDLSRTQVVDLTPLTDANLPKFRRLVLPDADIVDTTPVKRKFPKLELVA